MTTPRVGDSLPAALRDARVLDADGHAATLGSYLDGATLLLFLRPFGCVGCNQQIGRLLPRLRELRGVGVRTVLVGLGPPAHIAPFLSRAGANPEDVSAVTDPSCSAHHAAGLVRSIWGALGPRAIWGKLHAYNEGYRGGPLSGDAFQQGGAILVDARGRIAFYHRNPSAAEPADQSDIVDAALALGARTAHAEGGFVL